MVQVLAVEVMVVFVVVEVKADGARPPLSSTHYGLQGGIAIASFVMGALISCVCLFFIEPQGEITSSAIIIVSNFLVLCGGILGVKASTDVRFKNLEMKVDHQEGHTEKPTT